VGGAAYSPAAAADEGISVRTVTRRLSRAGLASLPSGVRRPAAVAPRVGMVHLGIGAFHRAHQAVFTEDASQASGSDAWGIVGVTERSARVRDQLVPQDGLYTLLERGDGAAGPRVIGAVRDVLSARDDPLAVAALIADPGVHVVTLTVTEKGYLRRPDGDLDLDDPAVAADVGGAGPATPVGQLARGLQARQRRGGQPVSVVSCDNLTGNGTVLSRLVHSFVAALPASEGAALLSYLETSVRFPSTMVDRIVPATTDAHRAAVRSLLGVEDAGVVVAEPFRQWVVTDDFAGPRPPWELAGAILTDDVAPWEAAKLRLLNATHSLLAYLGALRGYVTIAEAVGDSELAAAAHDLMRDDVVPTLVPPLGLDLEAYCTQVLHRFANPALAYTTAQVAMDGSQKLLARVLGTIRDRLAAGVVPESASLVVAAWMAYVGRAADGASGLSLDDPLADTLRARVAAADGEPGRLVDELLGVREIFGDDLREHAGLRAVLTEQVDRLSRR
jgi:fructuronate reductase